MIKIKYNFKKILGVSMVVLVFYSSVVSVVEAEDETPIGIWRIGITRLLNMFEDRVAHWTFDAGDVAWSSDTAGTVADRSGNGNTLALSGMSKLTSPSAGVTGQGLYFNGIDDYIDIGDDSDFDFGLNQDFTFSVWFKTSGSVADQPRFISKQQNNAGTAQGYFMRLDTSGAVEFWTRSSDGTVNDVHSSVTGLNDGKWHHAVGMREGTTVKVYVDGILSGSNSGHAESLSNGASYFIGRYNISAAGYYGGVMDDIRVYDSAISANEVQKIYYQGASSVKVSVSQTVNQIPGCSGYLCGVVGYWTMDGKDVTWSSQTAGTIIDRSGNGNGGTISDLNQVSSPVPGKIGQGLYFNGVDDEVVMSSASILEPSTYPYSFSAWIKRDEFNDPGPIYATDVGASAYRGTSFYISANNTLTTLVGDGGGSNAADRRSAEGSVVLYPGKWYHVVAVLNSDTDVNFYINGVLDPSVTYSGTGSSVSHTSNGPAIGRYQFGVNVHYFKGIIDDVRAYNRALTASDVSQLYNSGK